MGEEMMNAKDPELARRPFLATLTWLIGALVTAVYGIPAIAYLISPALQKAREEDWLRLGSISKVELGKPTLFKATIERQSGWIVNQEELTAYVITEDGRDYAAISNICTHLGCRVRWIEEQGEFFCPCHNGVFDKDGQVVDGPPPRPLDRYQTKVEDDQLFILGG
jgi:Rieske Fe-S protein